MTIFFVKSLNIFIITAVKSLSANYSIRIFLVLATVDCIFFFAYFLVSSCLVIFSCILFIVWYIVQPCDLLFSLKTVGFCSYLDSVHTPNLLPLLWKAAKISALFFTFYFLLSGSVESFLSLHHSVVSQDLGRVYMYVLGLPSVSLSWGISLSLASHFDTAEHHHLIV